MNNKDELLHEFDALDDLICTCGTSKIEYGCDFCDANMDFRRKLVDLVNTRPKTADRTAQDVKVKKPFPKIEDFAGFESETIDGVKTHVIYGKGPIKATDRERAAALEALEALDEWNENLKLPNTWIRRDLFFKVRTALTQSQGVDVDFSSAIERFKNRGDYTVIEGSHDYEVCELFFYHLAAKGLLK